MEDEEDGTEPDLDDRINALESTLVILLADLFRRYPEMPASTESDPFAFRFVTEPRIEEITEDVAAKAPGLPREEVRQEAAARLAGYELAMNGLVARAQEFLKSEVLGDGQERQS
jgi:hypothetical protein